MTSRDNQSETSESQGKLKRARTRRACDNCRVRKIKCDGNWPCSSCNLYVNECAYDQEGKRRYIGPLYTQELEKKLERLQSVLSTVAPDLDQASVLQCDGAVPLRNDQWRKHPRNNSRSRESSQQKVVNDEELLDTMIEMTGRLDIDDKGRCEYHSDFAGLAFLHRISERCSQLLNWGQMSKDTQQLFPRQIFTSAKMSPGVLSPGRLEVCLLPPKSIARHLTRVALQDACCLMKFVHTASFDAQLENIYNKAPESYTSGDTAFLSLLHLTLALGELYSKDLPPGTSLGSDADNMKGAMYYRAGKALIDIMDCHDITSLQAIICIIIYLQSAGSMQTCYSYISVAVASAYQMGLHRPSLLKYFDPIEQEVRKRIFSVLLTMDCYVATMLGLPRHVKEEYDDHYQPLDVDDEYITKDQILPMPAGHIPVMSLVNAHTRLLQIMARIVTRIYPSQKDLNGEHDSYQVNYAHVIKVEAELDEWFQNASRLSALNGPIPRQILRAQLLLHLTYAHVQMVLYRPFIHYIVRTKPYNDSELKSYACALACVKAAMQIIWLIKEMDRQDLLIGEYWFTTYMLFFAIMSLCMFALGNTNDPSLADTVRAALNGREVLLRLSTHTASAERCVYALGNIFDKIAVIANEQRPSSDAPVEGHVELKGSALAGDSAPKDHVLGVPDSSSLTYLPEGSEPSMANQNSWQRPEAENSMPVAAFGEVLGADSTSFPVFDPAWLDQAAALQTQHLCRSIHDSNLQ